MDVFRYEKAGQGRVATCHSFSRFDEIGFHAPVFDGERLAGASGAAHHFVGDKHDVVTFVNVADHGKVFGKRDRRPGCGAYNGLADKGGDVLRAFAFDDPLQFTGAKDTALQVGFLEWAAVAVTRRN